MDKQDKEIIKKLYELFKTKYINGLDYIRNNPNLTREEVQDHYKNLKDMKALEAEMLGYSLFLYNREGLHD
jgi:hypothetical protein